MIKILNLNLVDAFQDEVTYAIDTAKQCLDMLINDEPAPAPDETDGLLEFYGVFSRFVESPEYKFVIRPDTKQSILDYIAAIEMLCYDRSLKNMKFAQELSMFQKFPMVFVPPQMPEMPMPAIPMPPNPNQTSSVQMPNVMKQVDSELKQGAL
jgi:hypothetical protein